MALWHYTCDHGRAGIGDRGYLVPGVMLTDRVANLPCSRYVWLTDLAVPIRDALGLTGLIVKCDRVAHRYRVWDETTVRRWVDVARDVPRAIRENLESAPGARPAHWYVSEEPVPAVYDPR